MILESVRNTVIVSWWYQQAVFIGRLAPCSIQIQISYDRCGNDADNPKQSPNRFPTMMFIGLIKHSMVNWMINYASCPHAMLIPFVSCSMLLSQSFMLYALCSVSNTLYGWKFYMLLGNIEAAKLIAKRGKKRRQKWWPCNPRMEREHPYYFRPPRYLIQKYMADRLYCY